ncbi:hypothetical protein MU582_20615 [Nocardioidaceae bacterium SCSIO 66511]|nr:hypothetical protein MU582_20615 [Nocardioidaceae bacterium SCSIO 66511]
MTELKAPSRWWYAVAAAIFVLGFVPLVVLGTNAVSGLLDYDVHEFDDSSSTELQVDGDPVAIYSTYEGVGSVRCSGAAVSDDPSDATAQPGSLEHPVWDFTYTRNSDVWHRVAVTPDDWTDGTYEITCNLVSPGAGESQPQLAYADNPSVLGTALGLLIAVGVAGSAALAALVIVIVVAVKRSRINGPTGPRFPNAPPPY